MKNIFSFTNEKNGYSDILTRLQDLTLSFNGNLASTSGEQHSDPMTGDVYSVIQEFYKECESFRAPILYIWGNERQEQFSNGNQYCKNFIAEVNKIVADGNLNCLMNIAAEEHQLKTGAYPEWLLSELAQTEANIKNSIIAGHFDGLDSELYRRILSDFQQAGAVTIDDTKNSYDTNVANIKNYLLDVQMNELTHTGKQLFESFIPQLFESATPLMDLKAFKTNAQKVAPNDTKLMDVFKFVKKEIGDNPSLNVLINLAKEEHFQNTNRVSTKQEVDDVVKSLGDIWQGGTSEIEQAMKAGLFKNLKSNLAMELSLDIASGLKDTDNSVIEVKSIDKKEKFVDTLYESIRNLVVTNPIGILFEAEGFENKLIATNGKVIQVINENDQLSYQSINQQVIIPEDKYKLISALEMLDVNEEKTIIKPTKEWGFNVMINSDGQVILFDTINEQEVNTEIDKVDLQQFFQDTLDMFTSSLSTEEIVSYQMDADNFIMVALNFDHLTLLNDVVKIQSLNENAFVLIPEKHVIDQKITGDKMQIITSSSDNNSVEFPSYRELVNNINKKIGIKTEDEVNLLFEYQLIGEQQEVFTKQQQINQLKEEQSELNKQIDNKNKLLQIAEENSPAYIKITNESEELHQKLNENINNLEKLL